MNLHSIKFKISGVLIAVLSVVLFFETFYLRPVIEAGYMDSAKASQAEHARHIAAGFDRSFRRAKGELEALARMPELTSLEKKRMDQAISQANGVSQLFNYYFVMDREGRWLSYPSRPDMAGKFIPRHNMGWVKATFEQNRTVFLDAVLSRINTLVTGFSTPVRDQGGKPGALLRGVIVMSKENSVLDTVRENSFGENGYAFVVSASGKLVAHPGIDMEVADIPDYDYSAYQPVAGVIKGHEGLTEYDYQGETWVAAFHPIKTTGWGVVVQQPKSDLARGAALESRIVPVASVIAFSVIALLLYLVINYSLRPLGLLLEGIKSRKLPGGKPFSRDEVGQLAGEFMGLFEELASSEDGLRQANEELEGRVRERTSELERSNENLKREIEGRRRMEEQLRESLREKEVLLREIHHRVKNNIQIIASLLSLQSGYIEVPAAREPLMASQNRLKSMALIHEKLYQSDNLGGVVNLAAYLESLMTHLFRTYGVDRSVVTPEIKAGETHLNLSTMIPCGLIVNELVSNSLKHAFPDGRKGTVRVAFSNNGEGICTMLVSDDGVGLPGGVDFRSTRSLGLKLVNILAAQLDGSVDFENNRGTTFRVSFPT